MTNPESDKMVEQLLDGDIEFDDLQLEQIAQDDLVVIVQALRGHILRLSTLVGELSDHIKIVDAFARPKTSRRYFYAPGRERIIQ